MDKKVFGNQWLFRRSPALHIGLIQTVCAIGIFIAGCGPTFSDKTVAPLSSDTIRIEFLYLPALDKKTIMICNDSLVVERRDGRDSLLSCMSKKLTSNQFPSRDTIWWCMSRLPQKEFVRRGILDGTKIWLRINGKTTFCYNCLIDYVFEASGRQKIGKSRDIQRIQKIVEIANRLVIVAEGKPPVKNTFFEVQADLSKLHDSKRSYSVKIKTE